MSRVKCLNPWDAEGKRIFRTDGCMQTLFAGEGGHLRGVCYCIEGNVVDRVSNKNGKGWCEDVSPTLNTQDRHAVVFALEGNGARPSHLGKGFREDGTMYTLNTIEQHSVCYGIDQQGGKSNCGYAENVMPTLCSDSHGTPHAVCYSVDCRNLCINEEKSGTLQAKNVGGFSYNYLNPVMVEKQDESIRNREPSERQQSDD